MPGLSLEARNALRRNDRGYDVPETEADIWLHLGRLDADLQKARAEGDHVKLDVIRFSHAKTLAQLPSKSRQMYSLKEYRTIIMDILRKFPGLRNDFKAQSMEIFLKGRTIMVLPKTAAHTLTCAHTAPNTID